MPQQAKKIVLEDGISLRIFRARYGVELPLVSALSWGSRKILDSCAYLSFWVECSEGLRQDGFGLVTGVVPVSVCHVR
jgi:hypothetical protein